MYKWHKEGRRVLLRKSFCLGANRDYISLSKNGNFEALDFEEAEEAMNDPNVRWDGFSLTFWYCSWVYLHSDQTTSHQDLLWDKMISRMYHPSHLPHSLWDLYLLWILAKRTSLGSLTAFVWSSNHSKRLTAWKHAHIGLLIPTCVERERSASWLVSVKATCLFASSCWAFINEIRGYVIVAELFAMESTHKYILVKQRYCSLRSMARRSSFRWS